MTIEQPLNFQIVPVIDLMGSRAVAAKGGRRDAYAPVRSALCPDSAPLAVARALLDAAGADTLYVADLDAIMGKPDQRAVVRELMRALPGVSIWLDAGFRDVDGIRAWADGDTVVAVLGSETMRDANCLASWPGLSRPSTSSCSPIDQYVDARHEAGHDDCGRGRPILSLDFNTSGFRGPQETLDNEGAWPRTLIVMTLDRVGENQGPDLVRLRSIVARAGGRRVIAAGGVRDIADIEAVAEAGASGVLIASALHDRRIGQKEIAAFRGRRRFLITKPEV